MGLGCMGYFCIPTIYPIQWPNEIHLFIKIYLSSSSRKGPLFFVVWDIDGETYTQREDSFPYLLPGARGCQSLHPLASSSETTWSAACPTLDCDSLYSVQIWPRGSHHVVSFGYTPVVLECPDRAALFTNHNVTACHSTPGHLERTENPWHMLYNITFNVLRAYLLRK